MNLLVFFFLQSIKKRQNSTAVPLKESLGVVPTFDCFEIIRFCRTELHFSGFDPPPPPHLPPPPVAPALLSPSSHTCFGPEGGVWGSRCLYSNGSARWAIDGGIQNQLIPGSGETLWCGGTWKQRAAAWDPGWSLTIIKYYHPEAGGARGGRDTGSSWDPLAPVGGLQTHARTYAHPHTHCGFRKTQTVLFSRVKRAHASFDAPR